MKPSDVHAVLRAIGVDSLHHANTVTTSCTFLENAALLSRGFVESNRLLQTPQSSDPVDKKYGIWNRIFVDHVDIHYRGGRAKGPNQYGPVLFVLPLDALLGLPAGSDVCVTKQNPVHWQAPQADSDRWYQTRAELEKNINYGDFDKMLVINVSSGKLEFPKREARILLDDPQRNLSSGESAYVHAGARLGAAATAGRMTISIDKHACRSDCSCVKKYGSYVTDYFDSRFTRR